MEEDSFKAIEEENKIMENKEDNKAVEEENSKQEQQNTSKISLNDSLNNSFTQQFKSQIQQKKKNQSAQIAQLQKKLKNKNKEIGKKQKKIQKLQQAFKSKTNIANNLEKDRETLLTFIEIALKYKNKENFRKNQIGQYSLQQLLSHFQIQDPQSKQHPHQQNNQDKEERPEIQIQNLKNQIEVQKSKVQTLMKRNQNQEQQIANLKAENILKVFRSTVKQDNEQQLELHKKISFQSTEILKLKEKLSQAKNKITDLECNLRIAGQETSKKQEFESMKDQRQQQETKIQKTQHKVQNSLAYSEKDIFAQHSNKQKQFHQEKYQLQKRNSYLESSLRSTVEELNNLKLKLAQLTQLQQKQSLKRSAIKQDPFDQKVFFDLDNNVAKIHKLQEKVRDLQSVIQLQMENQKTLSLRVKQFKSIEGPGGTDIIYLKNIILKYMQYLAQKNLKQAETLQYVIFTVLRCEGKDLRRLVQLRESTGLFKFFKPKGMAPPNQARASKYKSQSSFDGNQDALSQSMIHTSRQQLQRNSLGDLNRSMHGYLNTDRTGAKGDQNIFNY